MNTSVAHLDEVLPLALRQRAENAVPEAANAAWVDQVVKEVLPAVGGWDRMASQRQIPIPVKQVAMQMHLPRRLGFEAAVPNTLQTDCGLL